MGLGCWNIYKFDAYFISKPPKIKCTKSAVSYLKQKKRPLVVGSNTPGGDFKELEIHLMSIKESLKVQISNAPSAMQSLHKPYEFICKNQNVKV